MPVHMAAVASDNGWRYAKGGWLMCLATATRGGKGLCLRGCGFSRKGNGVDNAFGWGNEENGGQREEGINERSRRRARSEVVRKRQVSGANTRTEAGEGVKG